MPGLCVAGTLMVPRASPYLGTAVEYLLSCWFLGMSDSSLQACVERDEQDYGVVWP